MRRPRGAHHRLSQRRLELEFDFFDHALAIRTSDGRRDALPLPGLTVKAFYHEVMARLARLDITLRIWPVPVEVVTAVPFDDDLRSAYDGEHARRFWHVLIRADEALHRFRAPFIGKVSPVHFFWGGFDLACTRFSGRSAPRHPGGVPNCADWVMVEGYSHELSSCGFWPGGGDEGAFYAYAYPEPSGFADYRVVPEQAFYSTENGQFLLPYEAVRTAADPDGTLLEFLHTTYRAAAECGNWDRATLEVDPHRWDGKR